MVGLQGKQMANFRTAMIAMAAAAAMVGSQAMAADISLAPGKPAGVHEAQHGSPSLWVIGGVAAAIVVGVVIATASSSNAVCGAAQGCVAPNTIVSPTTT
jgi:hypothetical protein